MLWIFLRAGIDSVPVWGPSLMALGAAVFLFAEGATTASHGGMAERIAAPVAWMGRMSYELYLFHIVLLALLQTWIPRKAMPIVMKPLWLVAFLAVASMIAWLIARFYSEPMNGWLRGKLAG